jgi:predicted Zn finger-like uncharacterized protein
VFTHCPHCQAVHALNAELLGRARGKVVCGRCKSSFNALRRLHDDMPSGKSQANKSRKTKGIPVLGAPESFDIDEGDGDLQATLAAGQPKTAARRAWLAALTLLLLTTALHLGWVYRDLGADSTTPATQRDPSKIHLVSRDIHPHPSRAGILVLSATFVNLAEQAQPYPELAVALLDEDNHPLASRLFPPSDYLPRGADPNSPMRPGSYVPILLEFADPGEAAVGFDLEFY